MITEDYCSYEIAELLKEKGFNVPLWFYYNNNKEIMLASWSGWEEDWNNCLINNEPSPFISAPTLQMAMKWLREVHNIFIEISVDEMIEGYQWALYYNDTKEIRPFSGLRDSYEEACEEAIKYVLKNLIEI